MSRRLLHGVLAVFGVACAVSAQQAGSIRGVVFDKDFAVPLGGAVLQILETGQRIESNDQGNFVFAQVRPGSYTVIAGKDGYVRTPRSVVVTAGQLTDLRIELLGEFTDLEEFVVQDSLQLASGTEQALLDIRFESPALVDSISSDLMTKANASDASQAIRLVAGASTANGKTAVIRGLPDRYVSSQMNGVLLPTADPDKRAVELDQFPSSVIESLQVTKTFTPDQQGNATGGAVDVVLRSVPDQPFFINWKVGTSYNPQVTGKRDFLTYEDGGVQPFGREGGQRGVQEVGENWTGAVGSETGVAPNNVQFSGTTGGRIDLGDGWRLGGLLNFFWRRDANFYENGRNETRELNDFGQPMTPKTETGTATQEPFVTALYQQSVSSQQVRWGGLGLLGIQNDDHSVSLSYLNTRAAEDVVVKAEDTQGKSYYFPGHDPDDPTSPGWGNLTAAPWTRLQTLSYSERSVESLQLRGRHRFDLYGFGPLRGAEFDWVTARSKSVRNTPDRREFSEWWQPDGLYHRLPPRGDFNLGNLQRTFLRIEERSEETAANLKLPFEILGGRKGYLKAGLFRDTVDRDLKQDTFSNQADPNFSSPGQWDGVDWTQQWLLEDHFIQANPTDVDYTGRQKLEASYVMLEVPVLRDLRLIGGVRWEKTNIGVVNDPDPGAVWLQPDPLSPGNYLLSGFGPGDADASIEQDNVLPAIAVVYDIVPSLTFRASYSKTLARQTFKELTPVLFQEYLGGPLFTGNPELRISQVQNIDFRLDFVPAEGSLLSASFFRKLIKDPIEYEERDVGAAIPTVVTADNYPSGRINGWEVEARQALGNLWSPLQGLSLGGNLTWLDSEVRIPESQLQIFRDELGVSRKSSRDMTNAPERIYNAFATWDIEATGTSLGAFYTVTGDTLLQSGNPATLSVPTTYDKRYDNLTVTFNQVLGRGVLLQIGASNLTNAERRQTYRSEFLAEEVTRRTYKNGVNYTISLSGEIRF